MLFVIFLNKGDVVYSLNKRRLSDFRSKAKDSRKMKIFSMVNPILSLHRIQLGLNAVNSGIKLTKLYNIPQITVPLYCSTNGAGTVTIPLTNGFRALTESGLGELWNRNENLNFN